MAAFPKHITVGPYRHTVVRSEAAIDRVSLTHSDVALWGNFNAEAQRITIRPTLPADMARVTLLHEILHACFEAAGRPCGEESEAEERVIRPVAPLLLDVLRRNPDLMAYLLA